MPAVDLKALLGRDPDDRARDRAYAELLRLVRIFVRARMGDRLRDHRESADVCQSIAKSFVDDAARGLLAFDSEQALHAYLQRVVRSKLAELARHDQTLKRTPAEGAGFIDGELAPHSGPTASMQTQAREAGETLVRRLSPEDAEIARLRAAGMEWSAIAVTLGLSEASLRQRWSRLQRRIASERPPDASSSGE